MGSGKNRLLAQRFELQLPIDTCDIGLSLIPVNLPFDRQHRSNFIEIRGAQELVLRCRIPEIYILPLLPIPLFLSSS